MPQEGPYDTANATRGVDRLIKSLEPVGIGAGANVYAELGSTWFLMLRRPVEAAHVLGKLLVALGPERIVWGTDSTWYGSPQPLIDAFRAFEIPERMQEEHGYPQFTPEVKERILSANARELYGVSDDTVRAVGAARDRAWVSNAVGRPHPRDRRRELNLARLLPAQRGHVRRATDQMPARAFHQERDRVLLVVARNREDERALRGLGTSLEVAVDHQALAPRKATEYETGTPTFGAGPHFTDAGTTNDRIAAAPDLPVVGVVASPLLELPHAVKPSAIAAACTPPSEFHVAHARADLRQAVPA